MSMIVMIPLLVCIIGLVILTIPVAFSSWSSRGIIGASMFFSGLLVVLLVIEHLKHGL